MPNIPGGRTRRSLPFMTCHFVMGLACILFLAGPTFAEEGLVEPTQSMDSVHGFAVRYPGGWSVERYASFSRLYGASAEELEGLDAAARGELPQVNVHTELRKDHAEAVRRLKEIEAEVDAPATFLEIGGWPALQRRYSRPRPHPEAGTAGEGPTEMITVVTTAVAAKNLLIRLEGWLPQDAPHDLVGQVDAIGLSVSATTLGNPDRIEREIDSLRKSPRLSFSPPPPSPPEIQSPAAAEDQAARAVPGASVSVSNDPIIDSELEIAVSANGRDIVIGSNGNYYYSDDAGQTWTVSNLTSGAPLNGTDPSVGWGQSGGTGGTFYAANVGRAAATGGFDSTDMHISTDGGATFSLQGFAYTCPTPGDPACPAGFPDQEHIAVDRFNVTAAGDQVYSAWRHLDGTWGIVCSQDSGATWSTSGVFTNGDFPRITVGQDSFVYVSYGAGGNAMLSKFNSCETNQNPMQKAQADRTVATGITSVACPIPGLDRCTRTRTMVAVDDTDANHIYVAYPVNTSPGGGGAPTCTNQNLCNEAIVVQDSLDGGATWNATYTPSGTCVGGFCTNNPAVACTDNADCLGDSRRAVVTVNSGVTARRFMSWVCSVGGNAYVTWFDRRAASPGGTLVSNNSLTDYFGASAFVDALGNLRAGPEFQVNDPGTADAQCEAGFPTGSPNSWPGLTHGQNADSCSVQPQLAGDCVDIGTCAGGFCSNNPTVACTNDGQCRIRQFVRCDMSDCGGAGNNTGPPCLCGAGFTCEGGAGSPKYGDYNGNACAAGRVYIAWASATGPPAAPATDIDSFFASKLVCCVPQIQVPGNVNLPDTCIGETDTATLEVCNTGEENLEIGSIASSDTQFVVTVPSSGYPVVVRPGSCFSFEIQFTSTSTGVEAATLTISSNDTVNPETTVQATAFVGEPDIATVIADSGDFGDVCLGEFEDLDLTVSNTGDCDLTVSNITSSSTQFKTAGVMSYPLVIGPGDSLEVPIRFEPAGSFGSRNATITIASDDPDTASRTVGMSGNVPPGDIRVTGSTDFGAVCAETLAETTVSVCNVESCGLSVTSATVNCPDFTLINNPFPATVSPDSCLDVVVRFTPTSAGPKTCQLTVGSDDPDTPAVTLTLTADTPLGSIDVPPGPDFPPTVIQSVGDCNSAMPFPVSNTGVCNLTITDLSITENPDEYSVVALPSYPIILQSGHTVGDGDLRTQFEPDELDRDRLGEVSVTYVRDPITGATMTQVQDLCGEGVRTGARVLVTHNGAPLPQVKSIRLHRINANRNKKPLDSVDNVRDVALRTVTPEPPCSPFQFHREYGTVSNPIQLPPGSYEVSVQTRINGSIRRMTAGFDVGTCDFNPTVVVDFTDAVATGAEVAM